MNTRPQAALVLVLACAPAPLLAQFGSEQVITQSSNGMRNIYVVDLDNDGDLDVTGWQEIDLVLRYFQNDGSGNFTPITISAPGETIYWVEPVDIDGNGFVDLITMMTLGWGDDTTQVYLNSGTGFTGPHDFNPVLENASVRCFDQDGDGDLDLIGYAGIGRNDGFPNISELVALPEVWGPIWGEYHHGVSSAHQVDLNNDLIPDILCSNGFSPTAIWMEGQGGMTLTPAHLLTERDTDAWTEPWNWDGDSDIDVLVTDGPQLLLMENDGNGSFMHVDTYIDVCGAHVVLWDVDQDGDLDPIQAADSGFRWHEMLPGFNWITHVGLALPLGTSPKFMALGDMDGDGEMDLVYSNSLDRVSYFHVGGAADVPEQTSSSGRPFRTIIADRGRDGNMLSVPSHGGQGTSCMMFDLRGEEIGVRAQMSTGSVRIDLGGLSTGHYYLRLANAEMVEQVRIMLVD